MKFLPVLAYDGSNMTQVDAGGILDIAMSGTSATLLARKWESAILVNVDNDTLRKIMNNPDALNAVMNIEGFRALGNDIFETVVNKSNAVKKAKKEKGEDATPSEKKELTAEEKEYKSKRKQIQDKLVKFATRIPAFMYLTDYRENTLQDVITKLEPGLFRAVTGLTVEDFHLLVNLGVFNATHMNQAVFAFRRYEDSSLSYTGIESHKGLRRYGLYDTVVAIDDAPPPDRLASHPPDRENIVCRSRLHAASKRCSPRSTSASTSCLRSSASSSGMSARSPNSSTASCAGTQSGRSCCGM